MFLASADWMDRNVFRRVEVCFPIEDPAIKKRIMADLDMYLQDNMGAWELQADGEWLQCHPKPGESPVSVQQNLLQELTESV